MGKAKDEETYCFDVMSAGNTCTVTLCLPRHQLLFIDVDATHELNHLAEALVPEAMHKAASKQICLDGTIKHPADPCPYMRTGLDEADSMQTSRLTSLASPLQ